MKPQSWTGSLKKQKLYAGRMKVISKHPLWTGKFLRTVLIRYSAHCNSSNMVETRDWEAVERVNCDGIVGIVPITEEGEIILIRQFRPPVNSFVIELPAGLCDSGESPEAAAGRELIEETGYSAGSIKFLVKGPMSSGSSAELLAVFLATDLTYVGIGKRDETEDIEVLKIPSEDLITSLLSMQEDGSLIDLKIYGLVELAMKSVRK
jgi:ADP-ribose pyrophosphatase